MLLSGKMAAKGSSMHSGEPKVNLIQYFVFGSAVGIISGLSGIGGGVILVPAMVIARGFGMHQAVGTSAVAIAIISVGGILSYVLNGLGVAGRPPYCLGYIDLFQWVLLAESSVFMAQAGARVAHRIPAEKLTYIFIAVMLYIGLRMIGTFGWLHLTL